MGYSIRSSLRSALDGPQYRGVSPLGETSLISLRAFRIEAGGAGE
jgi:hypothetical protein